MLHVEVRWLQSAGTQSHLVVEAEIRISVVDDGGSLAVVHQTRDAICNPVSQCRMCQTSGNLYKNAGQL
jgi:hypothetical protein